MRRVDGPGPAQPRFTNPEPVAASLVLSTHIWRSFDLWEGLEG